MYNKYKYKKPIIITRSMDYNIVDSIKSRSIIEQLKRNNKNKEYIETLTPTTIIIEEV
tara:strand:- start:280 stop:453 length:174 start_codon:yes stop_codon:yes gene_type:complete